MKLHSFHVSIKRKENGANRSKLVKNMEKCVAKAMLTFERAY